MKSELLKNTLIVGAGRIFAQFSAFLLIPLYTTFLRPEEYGVGDLIITYATLSLPLITLALEQGAFRLLVDARKDEIRKTQIISFLAKTTLSILLIAILVGFIIGYFWNKDLVSLSLLYIAGAVGINVCLWLARGFGDNLGYAKGSILVGLFSLGLSLVTVMGLHLGLLGMIGSLAAANVVGIVYYIVRLRLFKYVSFRTRNREVSKELLSYSLPLVPNSVSWWFVNAADRTIVALFLGVAATGIFAVAVKFPAILIALFSIFWVSWHESASLHIRSNDRHAFFSKVANTSILLFGTIGLGILAMLSIVFPVVVGQEYADAYMYVPLLMAGALLYTISTLYGSIYAATMKTRKILSTTIVAGLVSISATVVLIQFIGLFAAAIGSFLGCFVMTLYRYYDIRRHVEIRINWERMVVFMICASVSVGLYYINLPISNIINLIFVCVAGFFINKGIIMSAKEIIWEKLSRS